MVRANGSDFSPNPSQLHHFQHPVYLLLHEKPSSSMHVCQKDHAIVDIPLTSNYRGQMYIHARKTSFLLDTGSSFNLINPKIFSHLLKSNSSVSYFNAPLVIKTGNGVVRIAKPKVVTFDFTFPGTNIRAQMSALLVNKLAIPADIVFGQCFIKNTNAALTMTSNKVEKPFYYTLFTKSMIHLRNSERSFVVDLCNDIPPAWHGTIHIVSTNPMVRIVNNIQTIEPFQRRYTIILQSKLTDQELLIKNGTKLAKFKFLATKTPNLSIPIHYRDSDNTQIICPNTNVDVHIKDNDFEAFLSEQLDDNDHTIGTHHTPARKVTNFASLVEKTPSYQYNRFNILNLVNSNYIPPPTGRNFRKPSKAYQPKPFLYEAPLITNHRQAPHQSSAKPARTKQTRKKRTRRRLRRRQGSSLAKTEASKVNTTSTVTPLLQVTVTPTPALRKRLSRKSKPLLNINKSGMLSPGSVEYYTQVFYELQLLGILMGTKEFFNSKPKGNQSPPLNNVGTTFKSQPNNLLNNQDDSSYSYFAHNASKLVNVSTQTDVNLDALENIYAVNYKHNFDLNEQLQYDNLENFYKNLSKEKFLTYVPTLHCLPTSLKQPFYDILYKYRRIFSLPDAPPYLRCAKVEPMKIVLKPNAPYFIRSRPFQGSPTQADLLEKELHMLEKQGVLTRSTEIRYFHPIVMIKKPNLDSSSQEQAYRICTDLRALNLHTQISNQTLPNLDIILKQITSFNAPSSCFLKFDLKNSFHLLPLAKDSQQYTGIISPSGLHRLYTRAPMGYSESPQFLSTLLAPVLQTYRQEVLNNPLMIAENKKYSSEFSVLTISYLDDILIWFNHFDTRILIATAIFFQLLSSLDFTVNLIKTTFFEPQLTILGYTLKDKLISPAFRSLQKYSEVPVPTTRKLLRKFLCSLNFYRNNIPNFAVLTYPIRQEVNLKDSAPFQMTDDLIECFYRLKYILQHYCSLPLPDSTLPYQLYTDASTAGIAGFLSQTRFNCDTNKNELIPVAIFSKALTVRQQTYHVNLLELLAICYSLEAFQSYITPSKFPTKIYTDNTTCVYWLKNGFVQHQRPPILRLLARIYAFKVEISHIPTASNFIADYLSRLPLLPVNIKNNSVDYEQFAQKFDTMSFSQLFQISSAISEPETAIMNYMDIEFFSTQISQDEFQSAMTKDKFATALIIYLQTKKLPVESKLRSEVLRAHGDFVIEQNQLYKVDKFATTNRLRLYIPFSIRRRLIENYHINHFHNGITSTVKELESQFYLPYLRRAVTEVIKACTKCQQHKVIAADRKISLQSWSNPDAIFQRCFLDYFSLTINAKTFSVLILVDHFSRYLFAFSVPDMRTTTCVEKLFLVMSQFGKISQIITDSGSQFLNTLFQTVCRLYGISLTILSVRQAHSLLAESYVKILKAKLRIALSHTTDNFNYILQSAVSAINNTYKQALDTTPSFLFHRRVLEPLTVQTLDPVITLPQKYQVTFKHLLGSLIYFHSYVLNHFSNIDTSKHFIPDLQIGSLVLLKTAVAHGQTGPRYTGPFIISEITSNQYQLLHPNSMKLLPHKYQACDLKKYYDVFHPSTPSSVLPPPVPSTEDKDSHPFPALTLNMLKQNLQKLQKVQLNTCPEVSLSEPVVQPYKQIAMPPNTPPTLIPAQPSLNLAPQVRLPTPVIVPPPHTISVPTPPLPPQEPIPKGKISTDKPLHTYNTRSKAAKSPRKSYAEYRRFSV